MFKSIMEDLNTFINYIIKGFALALGALAALSLYNLIF